MVVGMRRLSKACGIRPLSDRVVVLPDEPEAKSKGGILMPDMAQQKPARGLVVAVGAGRILDIKDDEVFRAEPGVEVGDRVVYQRYGGSEVELNDETYMVLRADDIMAVIEGD